MKINKTSLTYQKFLKLEIWPVEHYIYAHVGGHVSSRASGGGATVRHFLFETSYYTDCVNKMNRSTK